MTERVTAYVCNKECGNISITPYDADINAITRTSTKVTASIQPSPIPAGCAIGTGKITAPIHETGQSKYCNLIEDDMLIWYRGATGYTLYDYITVIITHPDHCHWIKSEIWLNIVEIGPRPMGAELYAYSEINTGGQDCPDDKSDVFGGGGTSFFQVSQNLIVPGDLLTLYWRMNDGENEELIQAGTEWWCTCCFTGGEVTEIVGDYGDEDIQYLVTIQLVERTCLPSDFTEYEIGDWVFVHIPSSSCADRSRTAPCKQACEFEDVAHEAIDPLTPDEQEVAFQEWYAYWADITGIDPDPDHPEHYYDYRACYLGSGQPDEDLHWPSEYKLADHPDRFVDGIDTITGDHMPVILPFKIHNYGA